MLERDEFYHLKNTRMTMEKNGSTISSVGTDILATVESNLSECVDKNLKAWESLGNVDKAAAIAWGRISRMLQKSIENSNKIIAEVGAGGRTSGRLANTKIRGSRANDENDMPGGGARGGRQSVSTRSINELLKSNIEMLAMEAKEKVDQEGEQDEEEKEEEEEEKKSSVGEGEEEPGQTTRIENLEIDTTLESKLQAIIKSVLQTGSYSLPPTSSEEHTPRNNKLDKKTMLGNTIAHDALRAMNEKITLCNTSIHALTSTVKGFESQLEMKAETDDVEKVSEGQAERRRWGGVGVFPSTTKVFHLKFSQLQLLLALR